MKTQIEKYDALLKNQLDEKLKKLNKIFKQRLEKRDGYLEKLQKEINDRQDNLHSQPGGLDENIKSN